ncbi:MAG: selenocysteine-specific translation elongation factor [Paracoccus sp. (in: a-proteobacteria)]
MIVGTAGHIDHGKTALVKALTGTDADRLAEEKARGITIELGFAYADLGAGAVTGFVDVPGHERFVHTMLAGAGGIDLALLVIAADDGIMPQTREHLAILDLLGIGRGIVALTKSDLADAARIATLGAEIAALLAPTTLAGAPVLPVSALSGVGIGDLRDALAQAEAQAIRRASDGRFRLAVDRSFTLTGAGTVVTGTVLSGQVALGDQILISPSGLSARVRGIHAQNRKAEQGFAGQRCALNLTGDGISRDAISRGQVALDPALHAPTLRMDVELRLLATEARALQPWQPVHLHLGAAETSARVIALDGPLLPGGAGLAQIALDHPIAANVGDRFILRDISARRTIGGGRVVDLRAPCAAAPRRNGWPRCGPWRFQIRPGRWRNWPVTRPSIWTISPMTAPWLRPSWTVPLPIPPLR